jgi:peptidoglycan/LPS O-acetylase OafA/YrhL
MFNFPGALYLSASLAYMPRLDGLRALAVIGVLIEHFAPPSSALRALSPGGAGVTLFFVLSGYLITRILMNYRNAEIGAAAAHFYWRRFLRLSPPFYLAIAVGALANVPQMRDSWWVHALYLTNFQLGITGEWSGGADHFWSLCTEEQFYLLWFFIVVAFPAEFLTPAILVSLGVTLLFRTFVYVYNLPPLTTVLLPGNLASLAIGALLAEARTAPRLRWFADLTLSRRWLIATAAGFIAISLSLPFAKLPNALFYPFVVSAFGVCLVSAASADRKDALLDWLKWSPLRHIGKISYGIFVYHLFLPPILKHVPYLEWIARGSWKSFIVLVLASVAISHLSWVLYEGAFLRLKERVPLRSKAIVA